MTSSKGNKVPNQFMIHDDDGSLLFQSYDAIIVKYCTEAVILESGEVVSKRVTYLDANYWDYSRTTGKYRNEFLGEGIAETRAKIARGEYKLANLNK
jgi:hypothetical protein